MSGRKPVIAITHSKHQTRTSILAIKIAVFLAGGKPLMINEYANTDNFDYDGLVLYGGIDIDPEIYGEIKKEKYLYNTQRDALEIKHFNFAHKNDLPVLGICRGAQMINVVLGGNLHLDILKLNETAKYPSHLLGYIFFRKTICIKENSNLYKIIGSQTTRVNSLHRQSINMVAERFNVTAEDEHGIIQAIESTENKFILGVQFHPEFLIHRRKFLRIFKFLVNKAKNK